MQRIFEEFMDNDDLAELFDGHERFLMHLIGHHICALHYTTPNVCAGENDGTSVYSILGRFFSHSCYPNAMLVTSDRSTVAVTIRPIKVITIVGVLFTRLTPNQNKNLLER